MSTIRHRKSKFLVISGTVLFISGIVMSYGVPDPIGYLILGFAGLGVVIVFSGLLLYYNGRYADDPGGQ
jgi:hypothetical protein